MQILDGTDNQIKFEQIYYTYRDFMFRIANQILHNEYDAEDAVHNAFLSIVKNISKISDLQSPKTRGFIAIIAEQRAIDLYRDRKRHRTEDLSDHDVGVAFPYSDGHDLAWCIAQLPPKYREMVLLKYHYGYTTQEVSEILGISHAAASKLDQRAKKKLYELCKEEGIL